MNKRFEIKCVGMSLALGPLSYWAMLASQEAEKRSGVEAWWGIVSVALLMGAMMCLIIAGATVFARQCCDE